LRRAWGYAHGLQAAAAILAAAYFMPAGSDQFNRARGFDAPCDARNFWHAGFISSPTSRDTGMIDYHSAMAFEPFSDHVAPTLVPLPRRSVRPAITI
jgi:hypothetical protein